MMIQAYNYEYNPNEIDRPTIGMVQTETVRRCFGEVLGFYPHPLDIELTGAGLGCDIAKTNDFFCQALVSHYTLLTDSEVSISICSFMARVRGLDYTAMPKHIGKTWETARRILQAEHGAIDKMRVYALADLLACVDGSGVGNVVIDFVKKSRPDMKLINVQSTGGQNINILGNGRLSVPSVDIVNPAKGLLNTGRLFITDLGKIGGQSLQDIVTTELKAYSAKLTATGHMKLGNDPSIAKHDDTVIALSLGIFPFYVDRSTMSSVATKFRRPLIEFLEDYYKN